MLNIQETQDSTNKSEHKDFVEKMKTMKMSNLLKRMTTKYHVYVTYIYLRK